MAGWSVDARGVLQAWVQVAARYPLQNLLAPDCKELSATTPNATSVRLEPDQRNWTALLAMNSRPDTRTPLGYHRHGGIVLPLSASEASSLTRCPALVKAWETGGAAGARAVYVQPGAEFDPAGSGGGGSTSPRTRMSALGLLRQLDLARVPFDVPAASDVLLEVGANSRDTMDRRVLHKLPGAFLLTFEPLLDKWASLLSRYPTQPAPLGYHHARGIALPLAVSAEENAQLEFKLSGAIDGCASLLDAAASYYSAACTNANGPPLERRLVPAASLAAVLRWLPARGVAFAKIDAQGMDVAVLRSAGELVSRIHAVQMEVVRDSLRCPVQYAGALSKCAVTVSAMRELGYEPYGTNCSVHSFPEARGCEGEMTFVRPRTFNPTLVRTVCGDWDGKEHRYLKHFTGSCGPAASGQLG